MIFALIVIVVSGLRLPWNAQAALYAIYGATVGFYIAVLMGMLVILKMNQKKNKK